MINIDILYKITKNYNNFKIIQFMCTYIFNYKNTNNELKKILNYTVINVSIRVISIRTILNNRDISRVLN